MIQKKRLIAGCMAGVLLLSAGGIFYRNRDTEDTEIQTVQTEVQRGSIRKLIQGTGSLAPEGAKEIMIPSGVKIREVKVKSGDEVKAGDVLALADDNSVMAELLGTKEAIDDLQKKLKKADKSKSSYYEMLKKKVDLEEKLGILQKMKDSKTVTAETSGIILNVNGEKSKSDTAERSKDSSSQQESGASYSAGARIWPVGMQISAMDQNQTVQGKPGKRDVIRKIPEIRLNAPSTGEKPDSGEKNQQGKPEEGGEKKSQYKLQVTWTPEAEVFAADTVYTALVEITAEDGSCFQDGLQPSVAGAKVSDITYQRNGADGEIIQISLKAEFPKTESAEPEKDGEKDNTENTDSNTQNESGQQSSGQQGNNSQQGSGAQTEKDPQTQGKKESQSEKSKTDREKNKTEQQGNYLSGQSPENGQGGGDSISAGAVSGGSGEDFKAEGKEANTELTAFCTIASGEKMTVDIQVDEMDILSVAQGQKAEISLNAMPGQTYDGVISRINKNGAGQSGTTKYTVQIMLPRDEKMLFGMNVSAGIFVEERNDVLVVPAEAIVEKEGKSWVYLSADKKTGQLGEMHEVQTGLSDGIQIEVTKGMKEGQTLFYEPGTSADVTDEYLMDEM